MGARGPKPTQPCGTVAAYKRHRRAKEQPCGACAAAWAAVMYLGSEAQTLPPEMVTYSDPEGELVVGDYSFVTELEWFEGDSEPTPLRRQRWVCIEDEVGAYFPSDALICPRCGADGAGCATCGGVGRGGRQAGFVAK